LRELDTQKKLVEIKEQDQQNVATSPTTCHKPGTVPLFYPSKEIQKLLDQYKKDKK